MFPSSGRPRQQQVRARPNVMWMYVGAALAVAIVWILVIGPLHRTATQNTELLNLRQTIANLRGQLETLQSQVLVRSNSIAELQRKNVHVPANEGECDAAACSAFVHLLSVPSSWSVLLPIQTVPPFAIAYPPYYASTGINTNIDSMVVPKEAARTYEILHTILSGADAVSGIVVDVGSGVGFFSLYAAAMGMRVYSFEPNYHLARLQEMAVVANGFDDRVRLLPILIGRSPGLKDFYVPRDNADIATTVPKVLGDLANVDVSEVELNTLDSLITEPVYLLKIDTQGSEGRVVDGAVELVYGGHCKYILMEIWPEGLKDAGTDTETLVTHILSSGYSASDIYTGAEWTVANVAARIAALMGGETSKPSGELGGEKGEGRTDLLFTNPSWQSVVIKSQVKKSAPLRNPSGVAEGGGYASNVGGGVGEAVLGGDGQGGVVPPVTRNVAPVFQQFAQGG